MMTKALSLNGASKIYIVGRRKDKLDATAAEFPNVVPIVGDVTLKTDLQRIAAQVKAETGYINVLICNSGMLGPNVPVQPGGDVSAAEYGEAALGISMDEFNATLNVNVTAVLFSAYAFIGLLDEGNQRGGFGQKSQVLVTASIAAYNKLPASGIVSWRSLFFVFCAGSLLCYAVNAPLLPVLASHMSRLQKACVQKRNRATSALQHQQALVEQRTIVPDPWNHRPVVKHGKEKQAFILR